MVTQLISKPIAVVEDFPEAEVTRRLLIELHQIEEDNDIIRPDWEPLLDSMRVVGTVLAIEELFPFKIPPDKIVRKGGFSSIDDAIKYMVPQIRLIWVEKMKRRVTL